MVCHNYNIHASNSIDRDVLMFSGIAKFYFMRKASVHPNEILKAKMIK